MASEADGSRRIVEQCRTGHSDRPWLELCHCRPGKSKQSVTTPAGIRAPRTTNGSRASVLYYDRIVRGDRPPRRTALCKQDIHRLLSSQRFLKARQERMLSRDRLSIEERMQGHQRRNQQMPVLTFLDQMISVSSRMLKKSASVVGAPIADLSWCNRSDAKRLHVLNPLSGESNGYPEHDSPLRTLRPRRTSFLSILCGMSFWPETCHMQGFRSSMLRAHS